MAEPAGAVRVRPALLVDAVSKSFGGVNALESVSCHIEAGSTLGIIGPNGAGKSTLINVVSGLYRPDRGRVLLGGMTSPRRHWIGVPVRDSCALFSRPASSTA